MWAVAFGRSEGGRRRGGCSDEAIENRELKKGGDRFYTI